MYVLNPIYYLQVARKHKILWNSCPAFINCLSLAMVQSETFKEGFEVGEELTRQKLKNTDLSNTVVKTRDFSRFTLKTPCREMCQGDWFLGAVDDIFLCA